MKHFRLNPVCAIFLAASCIIPQSSAQTVEEAKVAEAAQATENEKTVKKKTEKVKPGGVKELSGISIIGNKEAPKSLYIVPWKNSEVGIRSSLTSGLLDESMRAIDKDVFIRELDFYELSHSK
ncbi:hypothetical protein MNBD_GAMMA11-685 [hydrothermal vent metagenome]|uniref:Uncharacterized protein n=1 Tax=hydrothermal vent metagenome TaxID=652676 RepID=A0A3B0X121_9ZZZZ